MPFQALESLNGNLKLPYCFERTQANFTKKIVWYEKGGDLFGTWQEEKIR